MTRRVKNEKGESFTLFFTMVSPFSNFHPCKFYQEDHCGDKKCFSCVEQFYMFMKAALFQDEDTADQVMKERNPKRMKSLGKNVKGFSQQRWDKLSPQVMEKALTAKFSQNKDLRWFLFLSQGSRMVEASPMDTVWGIGLPMDSPDAINPERWRGTNRLGNIMTDVREKLLKDIQFHEEAEEALREIALKGTSVFMDLQSDPNSGGGFGGTPQQGFKRRFSDMDHRDAKRQRTMDDFVSTPNSSSFGGNSRFGNRNVQTEPRNSRFGNRDAKTEPTELRNRGGYMDDNEERMARRAERFGMRGDGDMRNDGGRQDMRNDGGRPDMRNDGGRPDMRTDGGRQDMRRFPPDEEGRMRERIANRMPLLPSPQSRPFGRPPPLMGESPLPFPPSMDIHHQMPPHQGGERMRPPPPPLQFPPPLEFPPAHPPSHNYQGGNGMHSGPPLLPLPPSHLPVPPPHLPPLPPHPPPQLLPTTGTYMDFSNSSPMGVPPLPTGVPPPPMMEEKETPPPPPPPQVPMIIELQAGVVHSGAKKDEDTEMKEESASQSKKSKIKMNLQKEKVIFQTKSLEINPSIVSLRKHILEKEEKEELLKQEEREEKKAEEEKNEEKEEGEIEEGGVPKAYAIKSAVQSEKRRRAIRARNESSDDEEKKGKEEKKKGEMKEIEHSRDRRDNGDRRDERKSDLRGSIRERRDDSRDRNRRRSTSRDRVDRRSGRGDERRESREDYRSRDRREEERRRSDRNDRDRRDDSRRRDDKRVDRRSEEKKDKRKDDEEKEKDRRKSSVERKETEKTPKKEKMSKEEKKAKKAEKKAAKAAKKAEKKDKKKKKNDDEEDMKSGLNKEKEEKEEGTDQRMESVDEKKIEVKKDESEKKIEEVKEKDVNGIKGKNDNTEKSPEPKRAMIEPPGLVKHPIVEAPPPTAPPTRNTREQDLYQKLFKKKM